MSFVIGVMGVAGAGKDYVSGLLARKLRRAGYDVQLQRYATPLKEMCARVFGPDCENRDEKEEEGLVCIQSVDIAAYFDDPDAAMDELYHFYGERGLLDGPRHTTRFWCWSSPRLFQQLIGQVGRNIHPNYWVEAFNTCTRSDFVISPDTRFDNEVSNSEFVLFVSNAEAPPVSEHYSEFLARDLQQALTYGGSFSDSVDYVVFNEPGARHLLDSVLDTAVEKILDKWEDE